MNKITTWFSSRLAMAVVMVLSMAYAAAQNVLTIDPVTINSSAGVTVPVNLSSTNDIRTLIFDITLPAGVTVIGKPVMVANRLDLEEGETAADLFTIDINNNPENKGTNVWRIGLFGLYNYSVILAGEGPVVKLNLGITEAAYLAGGTFNETITTEKTNGVEGSDFQVTIVAPTRPVADVTVPAELNVVSGEKTKVQLSLENNLPVSALMFDVELPEALTLAKTGRRYDFTYGPRWSSSNSVTVTEKENGVRIIITNVSSNVIASAGKGELLSFYIIADDEHFKAQLNVTGIDAGMKWDNENVDVYSPSQTIEIMNPTLFDAVVAQIEEEQGLINELTMGFAEFVALVDEEFPAFKTLNGEAIGEVYAQIEALNKLFVGVQESAEETGVYTGVPKEDISNVTNALYALISDEAEALAKIENGTQADIEALEAIAEKVNPIIDDSDSYNEAVVDKAIEIFVALMGYQDAVWEANIKALNETGIYVSPITDEVLDLLDNELTALEELIKTTSINNMANDDVDAIYYDINGRGVNVPTAGNVYIKVVNGKSTKVIVK